MIGVIDYGAGNIRSISRGLEAAGGNVLVGQTGAELADVDALVLPGVGHAGQLIRALSDRGFDQAILSAVDRGIPYLGICVGMQIMFEDQEEGDTRGLGILPGRVVHLPRTQKTPHMGWSLVTAIKDSPFGVAGHSDYFYFVHSYAAVGSDLDAVVAVTDYGSSFPSVIVKDHVWGCQFHPEKSASSGIGFLAEFVKYVRSASTVREAIATA